MGFGRLMPVVSRKGGGILPLNPEEAFPGTLADWWDAGTGKTLASTKVSAWAGRVNGLAASQAVDAARPVDGGDVLVFSGAQWLDTAFATLSQPNTLIAAVKFTNWDNGTGVVVDGRNANRNQMAGNAAGQANVYAGSSVLASGSGLLTADVRYRMVAVINGASSFMRVNGVQVLSGNPGAAGLQARFGGDTGAARLNGEVDQIAIVDGLASMQQILAIEAWLTSVAP